MMNATTNISPTLFDQVALTRDITGLNAFEVWGAYLEDKEKRTLLESRQAAKRVAAILQDKPVKTVKSVVSTPKIAPVNDKKVAALRLYEANPDKNDGAMAKLIAKELEITYANAYYYCTRVFSRK